MNGPLRAGIHVWLWADPAWPDAAAIAARLLDLGVAGVIPQSGLDAPTWCARHMGAFVSVGLQVTAGLGFDGPHTDDERIAAVVAGLDLGGAVMIDWEAWDGRRAEAAAIAHSVLARRPDAASHITDAPWWAPLRLPSGHETHPNAPTVEFGRLCGGTRFPQCYGAARRRFGETPRGVQGRSARYLAWSRDPSQYASLGAWPVAPSYQMYERTIQDHVDALLPEPVVCLWDLLEMDPSCATALRVVKTLRAHGFDGAGAVRAFQASAGLVVDGIVGPKTLAALGLG